MGYFVPTLKSLKGLSGSCRITRFAPTRRFSRRLSCKLEPDGVRSPKLRPVQSDNQNCGADACTLWSLLTLSCFWCARAAESLSETIKLLRSQRIAPSLLRHIF